MAYSICVSSAGPLESRVNRDEVIVSGVALTANLRRLPKYETEETGFGW